MEEEDVKNDETFGALVEGDTQALPAFFGGSEGDLSGLGGEPNDFAALQSAEDHDAATKSQEDPEKNKFNDMTFGESLDDIPTEGLPGFFGGNESQQGSQTAGHQLKMQDSGNDDTEWKNKQEMFARFHEEFLREQESTGITFHEDASTDEQLKSLLTFSIDDDEELLQTAISVSQERREYVSGSDEGVKATSTSNEVRPPHAPSYLYSDTSFDQTATTTQERKHRVMQENVAQPLPEGNNIESLRQQIMQLQLALTSPPPLAPGLEGSPPTVEEYNRLIAQRQEACERLYSLYSYMKQIDDMAARQGHNTLGVSQQLAFLTSGPHAAVACPPIQAAYIKLFQTGSWRLPRKSKGRFMTSQETRLIASMQGRQLYFAGANNPGADWYLHMWRARRLQKIAQQYGFENIPEDTVLPAGSVQPMENSMDDTKLSVVWGNWTKSRLWETFNHVLGRAEKGSLNKPRRLLNLGDEPELPEKATKAPQADETPEQEDKQRVFEERKQEAKRKESQTRAAAKMLAGKLTEENPDKQSLWSARAAISAAHDALVCVRDAANLRSVRLKSAPAPSVEETEAMQQQIKRALAQLVRNLGLETNFEFGETKQQGQTNSHSLEELATPSDDGLAMLMIIVSMSKGKKLVCRAVPWLPPGPVAALITAAMQHLPHFVASAAEGSDAEEADELLSQSLAKWIRTAVMPQQNAADRVTLDLLTIWIRHLVESHDASILQALLNHPGGAKVFVALLERGKEEADALQNYFQSPNLDKRKKAQLGKSIDQWNKLTEKLAAATQSSS